MNPSTSGSAMDDGIKDRTSVGFTANTFPLQRLDGAEDDPFLKPFAKVTRLWQRSDGYLPLKSDISFRDFGGWHDRMIISDLREDGNIRFRLVGTTAEAIFGNLIKAGGSFADLPNTLFPHYASYFARIADGGTFGECIGLVPFEGREFLPLRVLDLPVLETPTDGANGGARRPTLLYSFFRSTR
ncbi:MULTISPECIES: hypothetical protein [Kordiimonas]|jgi:hypothetical protein|uniref:hypothetical protein n=1 Tax=Kordiimonas TaxID=288021 RepID=UPI00257ECA8F|nr:hypothetical protein [Kordiimonas sp. UBA4487]